MDAEQSRPLGADLQALAYGFYPCKHIRSPENTVSAGNGGWRCRRCKVLKERERKERIRNG